MNDANIPSPPTQRDIEAAKKALLCGDLILPQMLWKKSALYYASQLNEFKAIADTHDSNSAVKHIAEKWIRHFAKKASDAFTELGSLYDMDLEFKKARESYERAVELDPENIDANNALEECI